MKKFRAIPVLLLSFYVAKAGEISSSLPINPYSSFFKKAYEEHPSIPKGILEAVAFTNTRFTHLTDELPESCIGMPRAYSIMGLIKNGKNYFRNNLHTVSFFSRFSKDEIMASPEKCIRAYADAYEQAKNYLLIGNKIEDHVPILVFLSELPDNGDLQNNFAMNSYLYSVLSFLNNQQCANQYGFPQYNIDLKKIFGENNFRILSSSSVQIHSEKIIDSNGNEFEIKNIGTTVYKSDNPYIQSSPDYPPAIWDPTSCNYSSRNNVPVSAVTIHTVQGSYAGCISWFKNCNSNVSAHYVIRSSDGQVTQMVYESQKAWHVGSENPYTIGIEHEGYVNNPTWYTTAMYQSSANLCKDIVNSGYGINPLRTGFWPWLPNTYYNQSGIPGSCCKIKGHMHYPNQTHTDPGPHWNWDYFYKLINPQPAPTILTSPSGTFYDSGGANGNYSDDERNVWVISPPAATSVTLTFSSFNLENTWDYIYVYDGTDVWAPLIGYFTGTTNPGTLVANSGSMCIEFRSDCATTAAGWNASWTSNSTTVTPANLAVTALGCPSVGVTLSWQNSGNGWYVDVSDDPNFNNFYNKNVSFLTSVGCPGGFANINNPNIYLAFQPNTTYYWRIWDGNNHTLGSPFTTPICMYMDTSCSGSFDDTGGPLASYSGNEDWINIIQPMASSVTMTFTSFDLETNYDSLWIWDGQPNTTLIGIYTGTNSPGTVTANSGVMSIRFKSDPFVNNAGWTASWNCFSTTGIDESENHETMIFPNPSKGTFTITGLTTSEQITVYNMLGEKVGIETSTSNLEFKMLLHSKRGIYFYEIRKGDKIKSKGKLIIE